MKRIAVLTSGGDAPGMNAAVRAVVEQGMHHNIEVYGVQYGFRGLVNGDFRQLTVKECQHSVKRGGTLLYSARFPEFREVENQEKAIEQMKAHNIEALVVIGGDGSFTGALKLAEHGYPAIGIPGTIDNDIPGTEYTIGFDTAVNVALEAIDHVTDTAASHNRTFIVEVMGRHAGDMATWIGVAAGADVILIPEAPYTMEEVAQTIQSSRKLGRDYSLIVVAEGVMPAREFRKLYEAHTSEDVRDIRLSHIQRGGNPSVRDRVFATLMGAKAVDLLLEGKAGIYLGLKNEQLVTFDIIDTLKNCKHTVRHDLYELNKSLNDK